MRLRETRYDFFFFYKRFMHDTAKGNINSNAANWGEPERAPH